MYDQLESLIEAAVLLEEALAAERAWAQAQNQAVATMLERQRLADLTPALSAFVRQWASSPTR
jgi:hypothetical protein